MICRHVLRNALLPTIAVVATQIGYLIGGLVVVEKLFNYTGIGQRIFTAAQNKDFPMLQSGVLVIGVVVPRRRRCSPTSSTRCSIRASGSAARRMSAVAVDRSRRCPREAKALARARRCACSLRSKTFVVGMRRRPVLGLLRGPRQPHHAARPARTRRRAILAAPSGTTGSAPTSSAATCSRACSPARAASLDDRAAGDAARHRARHGARPGHRLLPRHASTTSSAASSTRCSRCPLIILAVTDHRSRSAARPAR